VWTSASGWAYHPRGFSLGRRCVAQPAARSSTIRKGVQP
jgi:hypothetical protein